MRTFDSAEINAIKEDAVAERELKDWDAALGLFDEAIKKLEECLDSATDEAARREIRMELADTYGMKGGTYRRMGERSKALEDYSRGLQLERVDKLSTYNASNVITLGVALGNISTADPQVQQDLDRVIADLDTKTRGPRGDEWWAWSDLGQFYLLRGRTDKAREAYRRAMSTGPTADEKIRHCDILAELRDASRFITPEIARDMDEIIRYLRP